MTTSTSIAPRALQTVDAARYLGVSPSLLRKLRMRGPDDPGEPGPAYIRLSRQLIVYELAELDAWLEGRRVPARCVIVSAPARTGFEK